MSDYENLFPSGLYMQETKIDSKKYYSVINDYKLLWYTSCKKSAKHVLEQHKEKLNNE